MAKWSLRCMNWRRRNNSPSSANHCCSSPWHCLGNLALCNHDIWPWAGQGDIWGPLYQLRVITHLPPVICRPEKCNQWIIRWMSWPGCIDSLGSKDRNMCSAVCQGASQDWPAPALDQMLEWAALPLHSHSDVDRETGHLHLVTKTNASEVNMRLVKIFGA